MRTFAITILLWLPTTLPAQQVEFGIRASAFPSVASFSGTDYLGGNHLLPAYGAEVGVCYFIKENIALSLGARYERKGLAVKSPVTDMFGNPDGHIDITIKIDYLIIPLYADFYFGKRKLLFARAGFYAGYVTNAMQNTEKFRNFPAIERNVRADFTEADLGATLGVGGRVPVSSKLNLECAVTSNNGLFNISTAAGVRSRNNSANLNVGLCYWFSRNTEE